MCFYQRAVRAYQRGVATRTVAGMRLPTRGMRLPTRGVRLPTTGVDEDGRRYAPTNEGCASTTDLLRCEVSSDHSDHVAAQKAGCRSILALGMTPATILRYIGTAKRPLNKVGIDIPTISKEKNGEKVNRQVWPRHELARVSDRLTERCC